ncbi:indole-3-acetic acid-amido synthetase GH3.6-like isoform X2 [Cucumis melo]|uniref:Indole-3-acetic acid-amido synthetase GH3.6-like isoform X2 n=1 Tax=Cucumis melo TaxID=3656 RepID=A0ABM3KBC2_CUCME|nr:indole-3-acetic acid-amido synthetase GH3.6-like isoform X2 [Cucumis melo]
MSNFEEKWLDEKDKEALQYIEDITTKADEIQRQILNEILSKNANVEYLQKHGLDASTDSSTFKKLIPLVYYQQLRPYIARIADGDDSSILCSNPITEFFKSYITPRMKQLFPNINWHKAKGLNFHFAKPEFKTKGGIVVRSIFTNLHKRSSNLRSMPSGNNTSPDDIILCTDSYQSLYCQLLCGLYQNDVVFRVSALFASTLIHVFKFLENHWIDLATDIRTRTINPKITSSSVRESVMKIVVKPNPEVADLIENECGKGRWEGIITRLWPNAKYINAVVTGSMSQYIPLLNYYTNNLPIVSDHYGSSECFLGLNLDPLCNPDEVSYTLIPTMAYFEFLPIDMLNPKGEVNQRLVDLVDVKLGHEYELVITTFAGLYRYCMGDVVRVTGFKNKAPNFSFVRRKNVVLNISNEKTDEAGLHKAVEEGGRVMKQFGATIVDYTTYADISTIPGHYVLYWELTLDDLKEQNLNYIPCSVFEDCCLAIENSLNLLYRLARSHEKCINPLEIKIVKAGTFEKLMQLALNRGASITQYKTPRCLNSSQIHIIQLLESNLVSNYFSKNYPNLE